MKNIYTTLIVALAFLVSGSLNGQALQFHHTTTALGGGGGNLVDIFVVNTDTASHNLGGYQISFLYDAPSSVGSPANIMNNFPGNFFYFGPAVDAPTGASPNCAGSAYTLKVGVATIPIAPLAVGPGAILNLATITFPTIGTPGCFQMAADSPVNQYSGSEGTGLNMLFSGVAPQTQALPIELVDFKAKKYRSNDVLLNWSTASEENSSHFEIERSTDKETWDYVGTVRAAGFSTQLLSYDYTDEKVYDGRSARQDFFYRLKVVDIDGQFEYSNIDNVVFTSAPNGDVTVYPNPSSKGLHVEFPVEAQELPRDMVLFDELGRTVYSMRVDEDTTYEYIDFAKANITSGIYMLQVRNSQSIISQKKIVVQR